MFKQIVPGTRAGLGLLIREYAAKGLVGGELYEGPWVNVGTVQQLEELNAPLAGKAQDSARDAS
jgi:MurNAc alpha-1-phosphate uridylyltransferase